MNNGEDMPTGGSAPEKLTFAQILAENLKMLNAKERDHLMRWAYLGVDGDNTQQGSPQKLSPTATLALHDLLELHPGHEVVFAAMDYHLSWIYAALLFACGNAPPGGGGGRVESLISKASTVTALPMDGEQGAFPGAGKKSTYWPIRSGNGSHEDIDLLVVFSDQKETVLAFVEAKGDSAFHRGSNRKQLARKLVRLDRILQLSGAANRPDVSYRVLLASPDADPGFNTLKERLSPVSVDPGSPADRVRLGQKLRRGQRQEKEQDQIARIQAEGFKNMVLELEVELFQSFQEAGQKTFATKLGEGMRWIHLKGFPKNAQMVKRRPHPQHPEQITHWWIQTRQAGAVDGQETKGLL
jgi:hypothetical protein